MAARLVADRHAVEHRAAAPCRRRGRATLVERPHPAERARPESASISATAARAIAARSSSGSTVGRRRGRAGGSWRNRTRPCRCRAARIASSVARPADLRKPSIALCGAPTRGPRRSSLASACASRQTVDDQRQPARRDEALRAREGEPGASSLSRDERAADPPPRAPACAPEFLRSAVRAESAISRRALASRASPRSTLWRARARGRYRRRARSPR